MQIWEIIRVLKTGTCRAGPQITEGAETERLPDWLDSLVSCSLKTRLDVK